MFDQFDDLFLSGVFALREVLLRQLLEVGPPAREQ